MEIGVGVQQAHRHAIGDGAAVGEVILGWVNAQMRRMSGKSPLALIEALPAIVEVGMTGDGSQTGRAEFLDPLLPARLLLGACSHDDRASCIQDSSSSSPK